MSRIEVHKVHGRCLSRCEDAIRAVDELVDAHRDARIVVVTAAPTALADAMRNACQDAADGHLEEGLARIRIELMRVRRALDIELVDPDSRALSDRIDATLVALETLRSCTAEHRDIMVSLAERLCARWFAHCLERRGIRATVLDAHRFLETDDAYEGARPLDGLAERSVQRALASQLDAGAVPVITGGVGTSPEGRPTTLGRGGADLTASFVAAALGAERVVLWNPRIAICTADPRLVPEARAIDALHYREATELSFYSNDVLHPRAVAPVAEARIPIEVRVLHGRACTRIDGQMAPTLHPARVIATIPEHALVSLEGRRMAGVPGVSARLFGALAGAGISVTMISQSSAESSISIAIPTPELDDALVAIKREFRMDITHGDIEEVSAQTSISLIAVVGLGMSQNPGVAGLVCDALGKADVNILAIAQGSSELNITLAVHTDTAQDAVVALHQALGLGHDEPADRDASVVDVCLIGAGRLSKAVLHLLAERAPQLHARFGVVPRVIALIDRSGVRFSRDGLKRETMLELFEHKSLGGSLRELGQGLRCDSTLEAIEHVLTHGFHRPIVIDCSNGSTTWQALRRAAELGADAIVANKGALTTPTECDRSLREAFIEARRILRAEATVCAGLPVLTTIEMVEQSGDTIDRIDGIVSSSLTWALGRVEEGARFSSAFAEAVRRGFTEENPVDDLTGLDAARKALILARAAGINADAGDIVSDPLIFIDHLPETPEEIERVLGAYDAEISARVAEAGDRGLKYRYVLRIHPGDLYVGPAAVAPNSPLVVFPRDVTGVCLHSSQYRSHPLTVLGPSLGVQAAATGVLEDLARIMAERR